MVQVPQRRIGTHGPEVSVLALGSWHTYDRMLFADAVTMVRHAADVGINLFDVGYYGGVMEDGVFHEAHTDILFGRIIEAAGVAREDYVLSVKLWVHVPDVSFAGQLDNLFRRVGTSYADFAVLGDIMGPPLDMPKLVAELGEQLEAGRLRGWGINNWPVEDVRAAHAAAIAAGVPGPEMAQLKYSVVRRSQADGEPYRRLIDELGITIQASDVMEGGLLVRPDSTRMIGRDPGDIRDRIPAAAERLAEIARRFDATPAQLAIAFCLTDPATTTVLFGASRMAQLTENLGALDVLDRHGDEIRAAVDELWLDRHVDPATGH